MSRTPHRTDLFLDVRVPPTKEMAAARSQVLELVRALQARFPDYGVEGEVYVTAPGAEIEEYHPLVAALDDAHAEVFGAPPERDVTRWFSDASALTRYGVPTVNYGTSTGLLDTVKGENLEIDGLVKTAEVYARAAMKICGVAGVRRARRLPARVRVLGAAPARDRGAAGADRRGSPHGVDRRHPDREGAVVRSPSRAAVRRRDEAVRRRRAARRRARRRRRRGDRPRPHGQFWKLRGGRDPDRPRTADEFLAYARPDTCKAVIDFRVGPSLLSTETRVHVADPAARRKFRRYWRVIRPFSGLIRILLLRAARKRAEAPA